MPSKIKKIYTFCFPENLPLRFELCQFYKSSYCLKIIFWRKKNEVFSWWKVTKFLRAPLSAHWRRVDARKKFGHFKLRPRKAIHFFWKIKKPLPARITHLHQVSYLSKLSYQWTTNERNRFFNSCHKIEILLDFSTPSLFYKEKML